MIRVSALIRKCQSWLPYAVWALALVGTLGSLGLSELMHLPPCVLCWYQRILLYPMVVIVGIGIARRDSAWGFYVLPMTALGAVLAFYHSLLQWGVLPEAVAPCNAAVSCVTKQINILGFITIPFLSFLSFVAVGMLTLAWLWGRGLVNFRRPR